MVVNNFEAIKNILNFDGKSVYLVWLVMRNKDGNTQAKGNNRNRTIKSYYFLTKEQLEMRQEEIIKLCDLFNCRAYIGINKKPMNKVLFQLQNTLTDYMQQYFGGNEFIPNIHALVDSSVMRCGTEGRRMWIVDIDTKDITQIEAIVSIINSCRSSFDCNVINELQTAHGVHLITHPFEIPQYEKLINENTDIREFPEIKKEGLTLLYANLVE
jgi:hypothetical protein